MTNQQDGWPPPPPSWAPPPQQPPPQNSPFWAPPQQTPPPSWPPPQHHHLQQPPQHSWTPPRPPRRGPDLSSVLTGIFHTIVLGVVVAISVVGWGWLKDDLAEFGRPVAAGTPSQPVPRTSEPRPSATPATPAPAGPTTTPTQATPSQATPAQATPTPTTPAAPATTNSPPPSVPRIDWGPLPKATASTRSGQLLQRNALYDQPIPSATCPPPRDRSRPDPTSEPW